MIIEDLFLELNDAKKKEKKKRSLISRIHEISVTGPYLSLTSL